MYTSNRETSILKHCVGCIFAAVFLALFGAVYEYFSHEVYSYYMIYAFSIPLVMGALPYGIMAMKNRNPGQTARNLWNSSIAVFSVGSLFQGILDIYGTTNRLIIVYLVVGGVLGIFALACFVLQCLTNNRQKNRG